MSGSDNLEVNAAKIIADNFNFNSHYGISTNLHFKRKALS